MVHATGVDPDFSHDLATGLQYRPATLKAREKEGNVTCWPAGHVKEEVKDGCNVGMISLVNDAARASMHMASCRSVFDVD